MCSSRSVVSGLTGRHVAGHGEMPGVISPPMRALLHEDLDPFDENGLGSGIAHRDREPVDVRGELVTDPKDVHRARSGRFVAAGWCNGPVACFFLVWIAGVCLS